MVTNIDDNGVHMLDVHNGNNDSSQFVPADLIILNADLPYATKSLFGVSSSMGESPSADKTLHEPRYDWDDSFLFSSGVVAFHWSIDKELVDLKTHNVFMAASLGRSQAEQSWRLLRPENKDENLCSNATSVEPFNFYVHCPTKTDATAAPKGCDSIMVLVPCPTLKRQSEYSNLPRDKAIALYKEQFNEERISELRQTVLKRFSAIDSLKDLPNHILDEVVDTPATYAEQYNVAAGAPFALSHGFGQLSLTRPGMNYHRSSSNSNPNVLFCGASSRPGNGVPLVLIGSKLVAKKAVSRLLRTCVNNS
jgi:phytoene desaturase (3,4-didehydrolycopene-forming)